MGKCHRVASFVTTAQAKEIVAKAVCHGDVPAHSQGNVRPWSARGAAGGVACA